jgi:hypothetical protein
VKEVFADIGDGGVSPAAVTLVLGTWLSEFDLELEKMATRVGEKKYP